MDAEQQRIQQQRVARDLRRQNRHRRIEENRPKVEAAAAVLARRKAWLYNKLRALPCHSWTGAGVCRIDDLTGEDATVGKHIYFRAPHCINWFLKFRPHPRDRRQSTRDKLDTYGSYFPVPGKVFSRLTEAKLKEALEYGREALRQTARYWSEAEDLYGPLYPEPSPTPTPTPTPTPHHEMSADAFQVKTLTVRHCPRPQLEWIHWVQTQELT